MYRYLFAVTITSIALVAPLAAQPTAKDVPTTLMLQPGKLLVSEDLNQPFGKEWFGTPCKWVVTEGVMRASELSSDMHAGVRRRTVKFDSAVVQFSFKFDGATMASLSMNAEKGHVCRVRFTPAGFTLIKDKDKSIDGKMIELDHVKTEIKKSEWHTMIVEMAGNEMVAQLDGKAVGFGSNDGLKTPKASVGFTVKGDSISFKNLRVYEGTPLKSWDATKVKLVAERKK